MSLRAGLHRFDALHSAEGWCYALELVRDGLRPLGPPVRAALAVAEAGHVLEGVEQLGGRTR
ncbi:MAG TPA: hypothetical protein VF164_09715, partial [Trueperaceae bacterium]